MPVTPSPQVAGPAVGSNSSFGNRPSRSESAAEPTNFWRRMLKGKQRSDRKNSPDRFGPATPNLPIAISSVSPDASLSPDPPESISLGSTHMPVTLPPVMGKKSLTVSKPLPESSSRAITPEPAPRWSARRDATANTTLNVTFVRSFTHKDIVMSVKFSADGKYLASALGGSSGSVAIFEVETGKKVGSVAAFWIEFQLFLNSK